MVLMTSKTSLQKWSGVFLFPSVSPVFFQIIALRRYFVNTKNGVEKSSSTPFSIDPKTA